MYREFFIRLALAAIEEIVLFRRTDIINDVQKHTKRTILSPLFYIKLLLFKVVRRVIIGVAILTKHDSLANKI